MKALSKEVVNKLNDGDIKEEVDGSVEKNNPSHKMPPNATPLDPTPSDATPPPNLAEEEPTVMLNRRQSSILDIVSKDPPLVLNILDFAGTDQCIIFLHLSFSLFLATD